MTEDYTTVIGPGVHIYGDLVGDGDIWIYGRVEGDVRIGGELRVLEGGELRGDVLAARVRVDGLLEGQVRATHTISVGPRGRLLADVEGQLYVAEGGLFRGLVEFEADLPPEPEDGAETSDQPALPARETDPGGEVTRPSVPLPEDEYDADPGDDTAPAEAVAEARTSSPMDETPAGNGGGEPFWEDPDASDQAPRRLPSVPSAERFVSSPAGSARQNVTTAGMRSVRDEDLPPPASAPVVVEPDPTPSVSLRPRIPAGDATSSARRRRRRRGTTSPGEARPQSLRIEPGELDSVRVQASAGRGKPEPARMPEPARIAEPARGAEPARVPEPDFRSLRQAPRSLPEEPPVVRTAARLSMRTGRGPAVQEAQPDYPSLRSDRSDGALSSADDLVDAWFEDDEA